MYILYSMTIWSKRIKINKIIIKNESSSSRRYRNGGNVMLEVLAEHKFPVTELIPVASEKSVGKKITFQGTEYTVIGLQQAVSLKPDLAQQELSFWGEWAPKFAQVGTTVVDNSSAWRMDDTKKLVIPEINADVLTKDDKIIYKP